MRLGDFLAYLQNEIGKLGSAKKAAEQWGISPAYLSDVILLKRDPGKKLLDAVGFERVVSYEPKGQP